MSRIEKADNAPVHEFMTAHPCATLATRGDYGPPNLANVFVYTDEDFNLYFVSRPEHRKHLNILSHSTVSLLFTDQNTVEQVEYAGTANQLTEANSVTEVLPQLQNILLLFKSRYWTPPVSQIKDHEGYVIMKVEPTKIVYRSYAAKGTESELKEVAVVL